MYLKITNSKECHNGLQYQDGLNIDPVPFAKEGSCVPGGIYFTTPEQICYFMYMGIYVREVTVPEDAEMVKDPQGDKWRASKVILGPRKYLGDVETWKWLVDNGVNILGFQNYPFRLAAERGYLEVMKYCVENGADINIANDMALIKYLVKQGANIHANNDEVLRESYFSSNLEAVKWLLEHGGDKVASGIDKGVDGIL